MPSPRSRPRSTENPFQLSFAEALFPPERLDRETLREASALELRAALVPVYSVQLHRVGVLTTDRQVIRSPADAARVFEHYGLPDKDREHLGILILDTKNQIIGIHTASIGVLDCALVNPREVFKIAMLAKNRARALWTNRCRSYPDCKIGHIPDVILSAILTDLDDFGWEERMRPARKSGPRLNDAARRLVIERILAGDSDDEVRLALREAGHPSDVSRQALWAYRDRPEVRKTLAEFTEKMQQVGLLHRARRAVNLLEHFQETDRRARGLVTDERGTIVEKEKVPNRDDLFLLEGMCKVSAHLMPLLEGGPRGKNSGYGDTSENEGEVEIQRRAPTRAEMLALYNDWLEAKMRAEGIEIPAFARPGVPADSGKEA